MSKKKKKSIEPDSSEDLGAMASLAASVPDAAPADDALQSDDASGNDPGASLGDWIDPIE